MRHLLPLLLLAGCAAQPTQCVTGHSPGVTITSTDPRIAAITIVHTITTVCLTPAYVDVAATPASGAAP